VRIAPIDALARGSEALLPILVSASASTVSTVAKQLDTVMAAFHARPPADVRSQKMSSVGFGVGA